MPPVQRGQEPLQGGGAGRFRVLQPRRAEEGEQGCGREGQEGQGPEPPRARPAKNDRGPRRGRRQEGPRVLRPLKAWAPVLT